MSRGNKQEREAQAMTPKMNNGVAMTEQQLDAVGVP